MRKKITSEKVTSPGTARSWIRALVGILTVMVVLAPDAAFAAAKGGTSTSWFQMFLFTGGPVGLFIVWSLVLLSALSIGFTIHQVLFYRRKQLLPEEVFDEIKQSLKAKQFNRAITLAEEDGSYLTRLISAALQEASHGYGAMERAIEEASDVEIARMLRPIEYLNVAGNISPMMGLFGTVYGMIVAFQQLVAAGGSPDPSKLAGGISTALVTTFWGLVVAIPALAAYSVIRNKIDSICSEGIILAEEIIEPFKPSGRSSSSSKSKSSRSSSSSSSDKRPSSSTSSASGGSAAPVAATASDDSSARPAPKPSPQPAAEAASERPASPGDKDVAKKSE